VESTTLVENFLNKTPWRTENLERDFPSLEFFDTLKSGHNDGLVQRCGKAHERRL
jgi:hypothetical protein